MPHSRYRFSLAFALLGAALAAQACSSHDSRPSAFNPDEGGEGGESGASNPRAGANSGGKNSGGASSAGTAGRPQGDAGSLSDGGANADGGAAAVGVSGAAGAGGGAAGTSAAGAAGEGTSSAGAAGSGPVVTPFPCASDSDSSAPPSFPAVCALSGQWAAGTAVPGAGSDSDTLLGITPDELTLAWSEQSGSAPTFHVADRASTSASFGAGQEISDVRVIGLSPDGLRLVVLSNDSSFLSEITRTDRSASFDTTDRSAFALINAAGGESGTTFQDCVISQDDHTLYYTTVTIGGGDGTLYASTRTSDEPWPVGQAFTECELQSHDAASRHPTGVSSDGLTLFYFDGVRGTSRAAWRQTVSSPFTWFVDLPDVTRPQPNAACNELYFSSPTGALQKSAPR